MTPFGAHQKLVTKVIFWSAIGGFTLTVVVGFFYDLAGLSMPDALWTALLVFLALLAIAFLGWAITFVRQPPVLPAGSRHVPKKYFGVALALLFLLCIGLIW